MHTRKALSTYDDSPAQNAPIDSHLQPELYVV